MPKSGAAAGGGKSGAAGRKVKPGAPKLINIADLKSVPPKGTLIYFTAQQWKEATSAIRIGKAVPKFGPRLVFFPFPDGGGVIQYSCISQPCEICLGRMTFDQEQGLGFECFCRPDPKCPSNPPPPPGAGCRLVISLRPRLLIDCAPTSCRGRCTLGAAGQLGQIVITCICGP
jgi:hypothetical protein